VRGVRVSLEEVEVLACRAAGLPAGAFAVAYDQGTAEEEGDDGGESAEAGGAAIAVATSAPDRGRLIGFFVRSAVGEGAGGDSLRGSLAVAMTPAQLPAALIPIDGSFPLTTTGKVSFPSRFSSSPHLDTLRGDRSSRQISEIDCAR